MLVVVITGVISTDLLDKRVEESRDVAGRRTAKEEARELTIRKRQERWVNEASER